MVCLETPARRAISSSVAESPRSKITSEAASRMASFLARSIWPAIRGMAEHPTSRGRRKDCALRYWMARPDPARRGLRAQHRPRIGARAMSDVLEADVIIAGAGLTGATLGLALASAGLKPILV